MRKGTSYILMLVAFALVAYASVAIRVDAAQGNNSKKKIANRPMTCDGPTPTPTETPVE